MRRMQFRRERVRVETQRHIIEGTLQLPNEGYRSRTTDFLNAHDSDFIALIDADVIWTDGAREPERQEFMAISARHVILVTELESFGVVDEPGPAVGADAPVAISTPPSVRRRSRECVTKGALRCDKWPRGGPVCGVRGAIVGGVCSETPNSSGIIEHAAGCWRSLASPLRSTASSRATSSSLPGSTPRPSRTA